jgi:SAM-dependent methyltransferase
MIVKNIFLFFIRFLFLFILKIIKFFKLRTLFLKISINLHNFSYKLIKIFLVDDNCNHPKHELQKYYLFFLNNVDKNSIVLDLGCGNGTLANKVSKKVKLLIGIDISLENINFAKNKVKSKNIKFICGDATSFDFLKLNISKFDCVILSNVLEHIENRILFLKDIHKLSDKILLRVPLITRDWLAYYKREYGYYYKLDPTHFTEYTVDELKRSNWKLESYYVEFGELYGIVVKN